MIKTWQMYDEKLPGIPAITPKKELFTSFTQEFRQVSNIRSRYMGVNLTLGELCQALSIPKNAIQELVNNGVIPYKKISGDNIGFSTDNIYDWLAGKLELNMDRKKYIEQFKGKLEKKCPETLQLLREWAGKYSDPVEPKRIYLEPVKNKKLGFVYYCRYLHNGKLVPSKWCTHTNDREAAEKFAIENRENLVSSYYKRAEDKKPYFNIYSVLKNYYVENSTYLQIDIKRGRSVCDSARRLYFNFMNKQFIPFLRKEKIKGVEQIDTPLLSKFQNYLLTDKKIKDKTGKINIIPGIKPQTIKIYISQISIIFDHLIQENKVKLNPVKSLIKIKTKDVHRKATGCYEVGKLKGVFNRKWKNEKLYLLTLLIYTTGMRNSEIENMRLADLVLIDKLHFINIPESKTPNGIRIVPLHDFVYRKLSAYIRKNNKTDYIFKYRDSKKSGSEVYKRANLELAEYTGYTAEQLESENIKFYSGRHFWKTLIDLFDNHIKPLDFQSL
jgi:integrase